MPSCKSPPESGSRSSAIPIFRESPQTSRLQLTVRRITFRRLDSRRHQHCNSRETRAPLTSAQSMSSMKQETRPSAPYWLSGRRRNGRY